MATTSSKGNTLDFDSINVFKKFSSYMPWYDSTGGHYSVIVQPAAIESTIELDDTAALKEQAIDAFIEFYLPEFYPFLYENGTGSDFLATYTTIRSEISDSLVFVKNSATESPFPSTTKFLFSTTSGEINFKLIRLGLLSHGMTQEETTANIQSIARELLVTRARNRDCPDDFDSGLPSYSSGLPSFATARTYFNNQQGISASPGTATQMSLGTLTEIINDLQIALRSYEQQVNMFPAPLRIPLSLPAIRSDLKRLLGTLKIYITKDINLSGYVVSPFGDDDTLRLEWDPQQQIQSISYEIDMGDDAVEEPLKIGLFSLVKYGAATKDRWLMATIANQYAIREDFRSNNTALGPGLPSFLEFVENTYRDLLVDPSANPSAGETAINFTGPPIPGVNADLYSKVFNGRDPDSPIDLANPSALAEKISTFMTSEEVGKIQAALQNPVLLTAMYNDSKSKSYTTNFPLPEIIDEVIELINAAQGISVQTEERRRIKEEISAIESEITYYEENVITLFNDGTMGGTEDDLAAYADLKVDLQNARNRLSKAKQGGSSAATSTPGGGTCEGSECAEGIVDRVLSLLGLADLIAEALICTTMGTTFSLERINQAIDLGFSIKDFVEDYGSPELPRPMLIMPDMPSINISFSITGDPPLWKQIRDIILQTLAEVAFDIIKGIAELIKHNCDNLLNRPENEGEIDLASAVANNPVGGSAGNGLDPTSQDLVDEAFAAHGFDQNTGYAYLSAIGSRLTPLEICRLFHSPDAVSDETIEKIRLSNLEFDEENIRAMQSRNEILGFFQSMAQIADVFQICNDIINNVDIRASFENYCLSCDDIASLADQASIQKLADFLNGDGIPVDVPEIDFLCPENDKFVPNPIVSRVIPQVYNTLIENVKMQFVYSLEAARVTLLEPFVSVNENPTLQAAIGAIPPKMRPPTPPAIDPAFLSILVDLLNTLSNAQIQIDPDICPDVNVAKFGVDVDDFLPMLGDLADILNNALSIHGGTISDVQTKLTEIQDTFDNSSANSIPYVTYVFPKAFKRAWASKSRQAVPDYLDIDGTGDASRNGRWAVRTKYPYTPGNPLIGNPGSATTYKSNLRNDRHSSALGRLQMRYFFQNDMGSLSNESIAIRFSSNDDIGHGRPIVQLRYPAGLLEGVSAAGYIEIESPDESFSPFYPAAGGSAGTNQAAIDSKLSGMGTGPAFNPYAFNFTYPLLRQLQTLTPGAMKWQDRKYLEDKLQKQVYPTALNGLIERTFDYIYTRGIFNMPKLMALNLFKDNSNCRPTDVGDLLDVRGIIDQGKKNFRQSACRDPGTTQERVSDALKLSLINLLIQVHIVEFLVKNIFVFGAFNFGEIMDKSILRTMMFKTVVAQVEDQLTAGRPDLKDFIYDHFAIVMERSSLGPDAGYPARQDDGIAHSYARPRSADPDLKDGADISSVDFSKLVNFLVAERINHTLEECGETVNTLQSINNVLKGAGANEAWEDVFIKDIIGVRECPYGRTSKSENGRIFLSKYVWWDSISNWSDLGACTVDIPWNKFSDDPTVENSVRLAERNAWDAGHSALVSGLGNGVSQEIIDGAVENYIINHGPRPSSITKRRIGSLREILGDANGGAMPIETKRAIDFVDLMEGITGPRPVFEGLAYGYKLIFNYPYEDSDYAGGANFDYDQDNSFFIESFKTTGDSRDIMRLAMQVQKKGATGAQGEEMNAILDSVQSDMMPQSGANNAGSQVLGELLTIEMNSVGTLNANTIADVILAGNWEPPPGMVSTGGSIEDNVDAGLFQVEVDTHPPTNPWSEDVNATTAYSVMQNFNNHSTDRYLETIKTHPEFSRFMNQTFNPELIMMVPLLYNFGLTSHFFPGIERDFQTTKNVILKLFETVGNTNKTPSIIQRNAADRLTDSFGSSGMSDMDENIREYILKALALAPIKILKGVVELTDPHVAISKIIRDITGQAFLLVSNAIDTGISQTAAGITPSPADPASSMLKGVLEKMSGEDLLALGLCGLSSLNAQAAAALPDPPGPLEAPLLGPRLTLDGVDFTGSIAGMLMMPPGPMGLIYLLIMILEGLGDDLDAAAEGGTTSADRQSNVSDGQTPNVC